MTIQQSGLIQQCLPAKTQEPSGGVLPGPAIDTDPAARLHSMGLAALRDGDPLEAERLLTRAAALAPQVAVLHYNLGLLLKQQNRLDEAVAAYRRAMAADAADPDIPYNLGNALMALADPRAAAQAFERAVALRSNWAFAHLNLASALRDIRVWDRAQAHFEKAAALAPDDPEIRWNRALFKLQTGDLATGWAEYEWRFKRRHARQVYPHDLGLARWAGQRIAHLLVHAEQGLGDTLMFVRYLALVRHRVDRLTLEVPPSLVRLMQSNALADAIAVFDEARAPQGGFNAALPLLSLPALVGTTLETIPGAVPYLQADAAIRDEWARQIAAGGFKIGLVWAGSDTDPRRACPLEALAPLARIAGVTLIGLQPRPGPADRPVMAKMAMADLGGRLGDFSDTAGVLAHLDMLVSVDTAAAHLAGAMGIPTVLLLPYCADWRWLIDRPDSPWYPSMTLVRQDRPGDWDQAVKKACVLVEAAAGAAQSVSITAAQAETWYDRGRDRHGAGDHGAAAAAYARALTLQPGHAPALNNLGALFLDQNRPDQAEDCFRRAIASDPALAAAHNNLGKLCQQRGDIRGALEHLERAVAADPGFARAHYNLGCSLLAAGFVERAVEALARAVALDPGFADAFVNLGSALQEVGRNTEAAEAFTRALALDPELVQAHWNLALVRLLLGDYVRGFEGYEWRWAKANWQAVYPHRYRLPAWDGKPFAGRRLYVHDEQGLGDAIQFVRFLPLVKALGGTVILETRQALVPLLKGLAGIDAVVARRGDGQPATHCDITAALMSLPRLLGTTIATIPCQVPYLFADSGRTAVWKDRLPAGRLRVGVVWAGRPTRADEALGLRQRSLTLEALAPVLSVKNLTFVGLQPDGPEEVVAGPGRDAALFNCGPQLTDFADTAAVMDQLDLVISVDTAAAHLAGALGRPVWVLLPFAADWRWLTDRNDSPWYPTMRLFRQERSGQWEGAVAAVAAALDDWVKQWMR